MMPLEDTQNRSDDRNIPLPRAGISGLRYPVTVRRPDGSEFTTVGTAELTATLDARLRGTHMSRFVETLHEYHTHLDPARMLELAAALRRRLESERACASVRLVWFREKTGPVSGRPGMVDYEVEWDASASAGYSRLRTTVVVPVATLCPCSKAISDRGAHNQRGEVTITVDAGHIWPDELIAVAESAASCELFSVLKRTDEKRVTEATYDNPVFVEDVVRNAALALRGLCGGQAFRVSAANFESIHNHSAVATVEEGRWQQ